MKDLNLRAINTLRKTFNKEVGLSDHSFRLDGSVFAVFSGATIIEKHFTISKKMKGPDHKISLLPNELKEMVKKIRHAEEILGDGKKIPKLSELKNIKIVRKSIVAKSNIFVGQKFTEKNITTKRPGTGTSPMDWKKVIGKNQRKTTRLMI